MNSRYRVRLDLDCSCGLYEVYDAEQPNEVLAVRSDYGAAQSFAREYSDWREGVDAWDTLQASPSYVERYKESTPFVCDEDRWVMQHSDDLRAE